MTLNSTEVTPVRKVRTKKPKKSGIALKPYPEFPLTANRHTRRWQKKIRGRVHYFGPLADPDGALKKYLEEKDALYAGLVPRKAQPDGFTIRKLCNHYMTSKREDLDLKEISPRTFAENFEVCERICDTLGKDRLVEDLLPEDFATLRTKMPKTWGPHRRGKFIRKTRGVFRFAMTEGKVEKVIRFGERFKPPSKKVMRQHKDEAGERMFSAEEIRAMLDAARPQLRCMILLAINTGYGNGDVGRLPIKALDLENGWTNFSRPKTGIKRRAKLWPETVAALREVLANRPKPKDEEDTDKVFITKYGKPWTKIISRTQADDTVKVYVDDSVSKETRKLMKKLGLNGHRNFYCFRHSFATVGSDSLDQIAVNAIMGHAAGAADEIPSQYRERISDTRLAAVADHVHRWLFAALEGEGQPGIIPMATRKQA